jgi:RNA polymerase sigma factor (sigma-70 family)
MALRNPPLTADVLVAHGEWLRRLAFYLLRDDADADDVVQEAWEAALRSPPDPKRPMRPWLAQVVRNAVQSSRRASARRRARELEALPESPADAADVLLARLQLQEKIARLMVGLEEPYRTTLVLRFYDGQDATEIGRLCDVPAGTVRWRISEGVRRLRARLDGPDPKTTDWRATLAPLTCAQSGAPAASPKPIRSPWFGVAAGGTLAAVAAGVLMMALDARIGTGWPRGQRSSAESNQQPAHTTTPEAGNMVTDSRIRFATFMGLALPALLAAGSTGVREGQRVDLDFRDADIHNVLRLLSNAARVNIWTADDVKGALTIKVKDMPWEQVVEQICRDRDLHWQRNDNVVLISRADLKPAQPYVGKRIDPDFTRNGKSIDVREAMASLSEAAQVKINVADDVQAAVNMRGRDMPWDQVLDVILWSKGLHAERRGNVIRVLRGP